MAQQRGTQQRDRVSQERSSTTAGNVTNTSDRPAGETDRTDRELGIQTGRETGTGVGRRRGTTPVYGTGIGGLSSPFGLMRRMADDMDRLFENFGFSRPGLGLSSGLGINRDLWSGTSALEEGMWSPQVETFRRGDKLVIRADLPGLKKDDVNLEFDDGILSISGERSEQNEQNQEDFYISERSYGRFYRAIPLPEGINADQAEAAFNDGVLEVTLPAPKETEHKARQIPIR